MAEGKSPDTQPERAEAHHVFAKHAPEKVRVNLPDGTPKDLAIDDKEEHEAHGLVACPSCGAPNHAAQLSDKEQPWIQCGCNGMRTEVALSKKGRAHVTSMREAMIAAVNEGRGMTSRG